MSRNANRHIFKILLVLAFFIFPNVYKECLAIPLHKEH